jgi:prohibitin 2
MNPRPSLIISIIVAVLAFITLTRSFVIVQTGTVGVVRVLGKIQEQTLPAGIHFIVPFITEVGTVDVRQISEHGKQQCFTSDLQTTAVEYVVRYSIPQDQVVKLISSYSGDVYTRIIQPKMNEALEQISPHYRADSIVQAREEIRSKALEKLRESVGAIVRIEDVVIPNIDLSNEVEHAIEQKMIQQQQAEAKEFELQKAKKDAEIKIVTAEAEAKSVKITGDALASVPQMIDLEVVKKWNGVAPQTVVIDGGGSNTNTVLPLVRDGRSANTVTPTVK